MATYNHGSPHPQATGTAATTAAKGMTTNAQSAIRIPGDCLPSVSGLGPCGVAGDLSRTVDDMAPLRGLLGPTCLRLRHRNLRNRSFARDRPMSSRLVGCRRDLSSPLVELSAQLVEVFMAPDRALQHRDRGHRHAHRLVPPVG